MNNKFIKVCISLFVVLTLLLSLPIFVFGEDEVFIIEQGNYVLAPYIDSIGLFTGFNDIYITFVPTIASTITYNGISIYVNDYGNVQEIYYFRLVDGNRVNTLVYTFSGGWSVPLTLVVLVDTGVTYDYEVFFSTNFIYIDDYYFSAIYQSGYSGGYQEGYDEGVADGIANSYQVGFDDGYNEGYSQGDIDGYERGYDEGYDLGLENSGNFLTDLLGNVVSAVATVFEIEIIGNFALGDLLIGIFGVVFATLFLKFFAGG